MTKALLVVLCLVPACALDDTELAVDSAEIRNRGGDETTSDSEPPTPAPTPTPAPSPSPPPLPDLIMIPSCQLDPSGQFISAKLYNQGAATAVGTVAISISVNGVSTLQWMGGAYAQVGWLAPSKSETFYVPAPAFCQTAECTFVFEADAFHRLDESNETNNVEIRYCTI